MSNRAQFYRRFERALRKLRPAIFQVTSKEPTIRLSVRGRVCCPITFVYFAEGRHLLAPSSAFAEDVVRTLGLTLPDVRVIVRAADHGLWFGEEDRRAREALLRRITEYVALGLEVEPPNIPELQEQLLKGYGTTAPDQDTTVVPETR